MFLQFLESVAALVKLVRIIQTDRVKPKHARIHERRILEEMCSHFSFFVAIIILRFYSVEIGVVCMR